MTGAGSDIAFGFRSLKQQPGFSALAVITLALGIGASTTIFSVIYHVLLNPFPYAGADRVVAIQVRDAVSARPGGRTYYPLREFLELKNGTRVFEDVIGGTNEDVLYSSGEGTELLQGALVSGNQFQFLGVPARIGRALTPEDAKPDAPPVFVLAHKAWLKYFNLDPSITGRTYVLNGQPTTLVGIMPARFTKLGADLWRPADLSMADPRVSSLYFNFQARVKPGITHEQVKADVEPILRRLAKEFPDNFPKNFSVQIIPWIDSVVGQFRKTLYTLAGAVALLLLIACGNVANMLLARASAREREMAIRSAMGATRARLIRQLLVESLLLAIAGALLGCLLSWAGIKGLVALIPEGLIPREAVIKLDPVVLAFSMAIAAATAIIFGLAPALQTVGQNLVEPLKDSGKGVSGGFRRGTLRNVLVVAEVTLSIVLLVGAGLLIRSFTALQEADLGFNPSNILVARLPLPKAQYTTAERKHRFFRQILERIQALPGATAVTAVSSLPPYGGIGTELIFSGRPSTERELGVIQFVSEGWFPTLGLTLRRGRTFSAFEVSSARHVAVVNETLARKYFPGEDPIGRSVRLKALETIAEPKIPNAAFEIIGVAADAKNSGIQEAARPEALVPYTVTGSFERGVLVRTAGNPMSLLASVRREIWAVDRGVAITLTGPLEGFLRDFSYAEPRFSLVLLTVFAATGLVLVAIGIYSVIAYTVSRQTHELGIRMALGAGRSGILRMVLWSGARLLIVGAVLGLAISFAASRLLANQLYGVSPHDPLTIAAVIVVIGLAGLAACYLPALRATRVDPIVALRYE